MKVSIVSISSLLVGLLEATSAFTPPSPLRLSSSSSRVVSTILHADAQQTDQAPATVSAPKVQELGLLTFDLDDTLYPIDQVVKAANDGFVTAMERHGFPGLSAFDIVETGKQVRAEMAKTDPKDASALTHTQIREMAIRREMEKVILKRKLQETADDWATPVESLSPIVRKHAETWSKGAVSDSVVQSVLTAWEMERHHAAERCLFPYVIDSLKEIKQQHPNVIIGAITDGRANPLLMTFTLAPYFDFCMSWEDHQGGRTKFFKELDNVAEGGDLTWIYDAARHKYAELKHAQNAINLAAGQGDEVEIKPLVWPESYDDLAWIHVGDDLAFDVGGSADCGAKTILVELPKKLGQTAPFRFDVSIDQPGWSTTTRKELEARIRMNEASRDKVSIQINTMERLPIAINEILRGDV